MIDVDIGYILIDIGLMLDAIGLDEYVWMNIPAHSN